MTGNHLVHKPRVLFLDVYETLLNMTEIERRINTIYNSRRGFSIWQELVRQYCFIDNSTGHFHDFRTIVEAALSVTGKMLGAAIQENHISDILHLMRQLPLHEDVPQALSLLYDAGFRLAALTNAPRNIVCDRMERTGLISYFEGVYSAEEVKKYKPAGEVYLWAASKMTVAPEDCLMVTTESWDITGAHHSGMKTAYIQSSRQAAYPLAPAPTFTVKDLSHLAQVIG